MAAIFDQAVTGVFKELDIASDAKDILVACGAEAKKLFATELNDTEYNSLPNAGCDNEPGIQLFIRRKELEAFNPMDTLYLRLYDSIDAPTWIILMNISRLTHDGDFKELLNSTPCAETIVIPIIDGECCPVYDDRLYFRYRYTKPRGN